MSNIVRFSAQISLQPLDVKSAYGCFEFGDLLVGCAGYIATTDGAINGQPAAEIIASSYQQHGPALTAYVLGEFCAVVIDQAQQTVVLMQDSIGLRAPYYQLRDNVLNCASDLHAMDDMIGLSEVDEDYLTTFIATATRPSFRSPWKDIAKLSLGQTLVWRNSVKKQLYPWAPKRERIAETGVEERLMRLVEEAVRGSTPQTGKVVAELSGGLDSTTVLAQGLRVRPDMEAITITSRSGRSGDDPEYAAIAAKELRPAQWHTLDQDICPPYMLPERPRELDPGSEMSAALRAEYCAKLTEINTEVLLTWREARDWVKVTNTQRSPAFLLFHYGVKTVVGFLQRRPYSIESRLDLSWLAEVNVLPPNDLHKRYRAASPGQQYYWDQAFLMSETESTTYNLALPFEIRNPLYYRPLMEFMGSVHHSLRRGRDGERVLQRRAMQGFLPEPVRLRTTKASNTTLYEQSLLSADSWIEPLLNQSLMEKKGWLDKTEWDNAVRQAQFGNAPASRQFETAMCIEHWLRNQMISQQC